MGADIISAITSAFGLVPDLAKLFLIAFQNLFMNATTVEGVTTYSGLNGLGIFCLVMFGINIGYGAIKFVMGLFRHTRS